MKSAQMDLSDTLVSLDETAARWRLALSDPNLPHSVRRNFDSWLNASPQHRAAYDAMHRSYEIAGAAAGEADILKMREAALRYRSSQKRHSYVWPVSVGATILLAISLSWLARQPAPLPARSVTTASTDSNIQIANHGEYSTQTGERSTLRLIDGSVVTLDTASAVSLDLTGHDREVRLLRGQASFDVAKDKTRPFVVYAADRRITAVGTAFDVRLSSEAVHVVLVEGKVAVDQLAVNPKESVRSSPLVRTDLQAGEELTAAVGGAAKVREANVERSTSWREGRLVFEGDRLADAIAEMNRYSAAPIVIADTSIGDLKISGVFSTGKPQAFALALTEYFQIDAEVQGDATILRWRH
jgi:transmembrane sensor